MKRILRIFLLNVGAIYFASQIAGGMQFNNYTEGVIKAGLALGLASFTIKPIVKILLLPITLATVGLFSFLANIIVLYLVDYALPEFSIVAFNFPGLTSNYLDLPKLDYTGIWAYFAFAVLISLFRGVINWVRK